MNNNRYNPPQYTQNGNYSDDVSRGGAPAKGEAVVDYFSTDEIFKRVAASANEEFGLPTRQLFLSGLAAGLSIGLSFLARAAVTARVPGDESGLLGSLIYPIGFLFIVMGRYQLYTENTLTPVTLVLTRIASIPMLLRNWGIVLAANLIGAAMIAFALATTGVFEPETAEVATEFGLHGLETSWNDLVVKGMIAGWLVAGMVWIIHAARDSLTRFFTVFIIMFLVPSADLFHCIIGACEAFYLVFHGDATLYDAMFNFFLPVLIGNTLGGVLLVAILNFAQTHDSRFPDGNHGQVRLTWREWLFGYYSGTPTAESSEPTHTDFDETPLVEPADPEHDHIFGSNESEISLVQYGDYECPTSLNIYTLVQDLRYHLEDDFSYVFRQLPLTQTHPHALEAAQAAEAAAMQDRFWDMHDKLFRGHDHLENSDLYRYAEELNLDPQRFEHDLNSEAVQQKIDTDRQSALASGVRGTNSLFINGVRYSGALTVKDVTRAVREVIKRRNSEADPA